ncbi:MAG TPA: PP2C family serine/threonine-protein phosphatase [Herpetosiphonaceae bacterium]|nr:PP2C family serine/threonine-protein phosphatase [Herpetosiphonaceae bacterium]
MTQNQAWRSVGVSVTGPAHADDGGECQDDFAVATGRSGVIVAVACDGAGSTRHGGTAARITCEVLPPILLRRLSLEDEEGKAVPRELARARRKVVKALAEARSILLTHAAEQKLDTDEFLSTLVGVIAHPRIGGIFFHIGDGAALCFDASGSMLTLSPPENGEYLNTTYFFVEDEWRRHLRVRFFPAGFKTIVLMTDGATDLALERRPGRKVVPFAPFFTPVLRFLAAADAAEGERGLREILDGPSAREKVDDDKTLVWLEALSNDD